MPVVRGYGLSVARAALTSNERKGTPAVAEQTPQQLAAYAEVSDALDLEGYGDLLKGQAVDVRDAVAQMQLDAEQMAERAARLHQVLAEADAQADQERRAADLE